MPWLRNGCFVFAMTFPTFKHINLVLRMFVQEDTTMSLVIPYWPKREFSTLLHLAEEFPLMLPEREDLLSQGPVLLPKIQSLKLSAWHLKKASRSLRGFQISG